MNGTTDNKSGCVAAVVDIAGAMRNIWGLAVPGNGAEQRVVAALAVTATLAAVDRALGLAPGALRRGVEIECDRAPA